MATRYTEATDELLEMANEIINEYFRELRSVKIKYIFDNKKRTAGGKVVLGKCQRAQEMVRFLTVGEANDEDGYQYVISIDGCAWDNITRQDRIRLLRHELRHCLVDEEARQMYKISPHDIEDFSAEIELNTDDVRWAERVANLTEQIYGQQRDEEEEG
jgi:hypothetical protein